MAERVSADELPFEEGLDLIGNQLGILARLLRAADCFGDAVKAIAKRQTQDNVVTGAFLQRLESDDRSIRQAKLDHFDIGYGSVAADPAKRGRHIWILQRHAAHRQLPIRRQSIARRRTFATKVSTFPARRAG